tara:strand:- start:461 stop:940 length:480 start_codon:yes stop_codon:yes gene_type:complete
MIDAVKNMPNVKLKIINNGVINLSDSRNLSKGKKIIIFGIPGAYTGTCSNEHLPGYIKLSDKFKKKGIDDIYCMSVNDPYVMQAWQLSYKKGNKVIMIADGNGDLTKALELDEDRSNNFMGLRSKRFALIADNNQIITLNVDEQGKYEVSAAEYILNQI